MNWIKEVLESERQLVVPIMTHPGIEAIGNSVKDAVTNGEVHYKAIKYLADNYPSDACTAIMDLTLEAEAFGATVNMPEDEIPTVTGRLIWNMESAVALKIPDLKAGRMPEYLKANKLAVKNIPGKVILSGCIGPFSLAGRLYDMSEIMIGIYIDPDTINLLLEKCTKFITGYCMALKEIGTQGIVIAEPAAGLLSNEDCMMYSTKYVTQIVDAVQDENFTVVLHNCGNKGHCTKAMVASGAATLHFGNAIDLENVLKEVPEDVLVMGNLDPVSVFKQGTPEMIQKAVKDLLHKTAGYKNFIISSGCDLPPHVPKENIDAFFEVVAERQSR